jgi:hypothetical protein
MRRPLSDRLSHQKAYFVKKSSNPEDLTVEYIDSEDVPLFRWFGVFARWPGHGPGEIDIRARVMR